MALTPGTRLGVYEITVQIGEGGMGQVYRARDTKLNRDVALKVLPDSVADDSDRLARFTREAQTLASLNHPNIAHIHGLEESGGVTRPRDGTRRGRGSVATHRARPDSASTKRCRSPGRSRKLSKRRTSRGSSTAISKPANIKVRPDGTVKVLDFGLAKALGSGRSRRDGGRHDVADDHVSRR